MGTEIAGKPHTSPLVGDEKVPLSPDGFATTQEIADLGGGGSGLPPQWTDGGNGDVTATVNDPTKTPIEIVGLVDQEDPLLFITSDTPLGTADLLVVRKSVGEGGREIFTIDDSGEVDIRVIDTNADALTIAALDDASLGEGKMLLVTAHGVNRNSLVEFNDVDSGAQFQFGGIAGFRLRNSTVEVIAGAGQTDPLLDLKDESDVTVASVGPHGETVIQPTDVDAIALVLQALAGQDVDAPQLLIRDELGHEMWSLAQEPDAAGLTHHVGLRDSSDSEWNALFYIQLDNHEAGSQYQEAAFGLGTFHNGNAILFDTFWNEAAPADSYTNFALRRFDDQTVPIVTISEQVGNDRLFVVGKAGAIGTSAGEPADGDILPGECFRYFIPTNGAAKTGFKGKTLDGTVVKREDSIP